ncbi:MAG: GNAT family N-acetyltransferase [Ardenticatenaceae bacterium]|nr:GNAT family N-acetyltransferase [Anaerolineales bacterium]MCB8918658.1 GNAT family N-acetyltransferase [Ardenticatenaceae bacterium]
MMPEPVITPAGTLPAGIQLRLAQPADELLFPTCFPHRDPRQLREEFRRSLQPRAASRRVRLVAVDSANQPVGSGQLLRYPSSAEIADLGVAPAWRNQGIGSALVLTLTEFARLAGYSFVEIGVVVSNRPALALYQRLGFAWDREITRPGKEPAIILCKIFTPD